MGHNMLARLIYILTLVFWLRLCNGTAGYVYMYFSAYTTRWIWVPKTEDRIQE